MSFQLRAHRQFLHARCMSYWIHWGVVTLFEVEERVFKRANSTSRSSRVGSSRGCLPKIRSKLCFLNGSIVHIQAQTQTFKQATMPDAFTNISFWKLIFVCANSGKKTVSIGADSFYVSLRLWSPQYLRSRLKSCYKLCSGVMLYVLRLDASCS